MSSSLVPPHASARRAALLEQLVIALTTTAGDSLAIRTRAPDDPTIALLDAWATVGDVHGFYLDRIAGEGYLSTATEPGSILALAGLVGYQPAPGVAAQVHLAYTLGPDAADKAVQFDPGLRFQTVPGPGQQPQTFESADGLTARPSWNLLKPKSSRPLSADTTELVVNGTTANVAPNDMILLGLAGAAPAPVSVATASIDYVGGMTNVTLQQPAQPPPPAPPAPPAPPPPTTVESAIDSLVSGGLGAAPEPVPKSANDLPRSAKSVFAPGSDAVPRLLSTMQPAVAATLYSALNATPLGSPSVTGASVMRVKAAPFGAQAPPKPVFDQSGKPIGTEDWPIGDAFTLRLTVTEGDFARLMGMAIQAVQPPSIPRWLARLVRPQPPAEPTPAPVIDVQCSLGTTDGQDIIDVTGNAPWTAMPTPFGEVSLQPTQDGQGVTLSYTSTAAPSTPALAIVASLAPNTDAVTIEFTAPSPSVGTQVWDPNVHTEFAGQVGNTKLSIEWSKPSSGESSLTASIEVPLPLASLNVLPLDGIHSGILPGTEVVIHNAADPGQPVVATTQAVDTVAASAYGITGKVTQLTLDTNWLSDQDVLQSALRPLTVYAQPDPVSLQPAPVTEDVAGAAIDLDGLVAGMAPGRLVAVTGTRTGLPNQATVQSGEIAMVASVSAGGAAGETTHSTLNLAGQLGYSYQRDSVQIYGNVVSAHQGATISQVLGSGQPAQAPQSFTLSSGPVLADPSDSAPGFQSTLTVTVNGVPYAKVDRVDEATPGESFLTGIEASGQTTVTFPFPLPAGTGNILATYRTGAGGQGNAAAGQITQLLTRPASLSGVINPLPASGGSGGDDQDSVRAAAPLGLSGLGRVVTMSDYTALARSFSGVGKATAAPYAGQSVLVTIASTDPVQLDAGASLCSAVAAAIGAVADPTLSVSVVPATLYQIALTADVVHDPQVSWDETVAAVRAALVAGLGYSSRQLGQDVTLSDVMAAAHSATAVRSFTVTGLALVPFTASAGQLASTLPTLLTSPVPKVTTTSSAVAAWAPAVPPGGPNAAAVAYVSASAPDTLILTERSS